MKILVVCQYYFPEPFTITEICEELVKRGHDVHVLTAKPNYGCYKIMEGYENVDFEIVNGVKLYRIDVIPRKESAMSIIGNYLSFYHRAKKFVKKLPNDFDVVYSMSLSPVISIAPANKYAKKHSIQHVLHCLDLWPASVVATGTFKKNSFMYNILLWWSKKTYRRVDSILLSSPSFEDYFLNYLNIKKTMQFVPQPTLEFSAKTPYIFDDNFFNIVYCGNIGKLQCVDLLVSALSKLNNKDVRLYIIGQGCEKDNVMNLVEKLRLSKNVFYLGSKPRKEAAAYFYNADMFYVGLKNDEYVGKTIPNKIITYLKYGHPIVGAIEGDGRKVLIEAQGDNFVSDYNVENISKCIEKVMKLSSEEKETIKNRSEAYYRDNFSIEVVVDKVEKELKNRTN